MTSKILRHILVLPAAALASFVSYQTAVFISGIAVFTSSFLFDSFGGMFDVLSEILAGWLAACAFVAIGIMVAPSHHKAYAIFLALFVCVITWSIGIHYCLKIHEISYEYLFYSLCTSASAILNALMYKDYIRK